MTGLENLEAAGGEFYFNADGELFAADPVTNALTPVSELPAPTPSDGWETTHDTAPKILAAAITIHWVVMTPLNGIGAPDTGAGLTADAEVLRGIGDRGVSRQRPRVAGSGRTVVRRPKLRTAGPHHPDGRTRHRIGGPAANPGCRGGRTAQQYVRGRRDALSGDPHRMGALPDCAARWAEIIDGLPNSHGHCMSGLRCQPPDQTGPPIPRDRRRDGEGGCQLRGDRRGGTGITTAALTRRHRGEY